MIRYCSLASQQPSLTTDNNCSWHSCLFSASALRTQRNSSATDLSLFPCRQAEADALVMVLEAGQMPLQDGWQQGLAEQGLGPVPLVAWLDELASQVSTSCRKQEKCDMSALQASSACCFL